MGNDRAPLLLEVGLKWPPEHYLRRKLEGLAAGGMEVAVATATPRRDGDEVLRGVRRVRLPGRDEPAAVALVGLTRDCIRLGLRRPRALLTAAARGQANGPPREAHDQAPPQPGRGHARGARRWSTSSGSPDAADFLPLFEAFGCPVVVSNHGGIHYRPRIGERRITSAYPAIFARAAAVHCVSEAVRDEAVRFGLDRAKARVIHSGIDVDFFTPAPSDDRDPEELRVIGVGRLIWQKGYDFALEAVASLADAGVPVTYEILGGEPSAVTGRPTRSPPAALPDPRARPRGPGDAARQGLAGDGP